MTWSCISYWIEHNPGLASWVQAIGAILAIIAALLVSYQQIKNQSLQGVEQRKQKSAAFRAIAKHAVDTSNDFAEFVDHSVVYFIFKKNWDLMYRHNLESSIHSLELLPAHELETAGLVVAHSGLLASIKSLLSAVELCMAKDTGGDTYSEIKIESSIRAQHMNFYWSNYEKSYEAMRKGKAQ
jgi:hypothetical protein